MAETAARPVRLDAAVAVGDAAAAQSMCDRPDLPNVPDGYSADREEMQDAEGAVEGYADAMCEYLDCLQGEHEEACDELDDTDSEWESTTVSDFKNR